MVSQEIRMSLSSTSMVIMETEVTQDGVGNYAWTEQYGDGNSAFEIQSGTDTMLMYTSTVWIALHIQPKPATVTLPL
jgi:hypothetical protein